GAEPERLETMRAGHAVGEVGILTGAGRGASVRADERTVLYRLSHDALQRMARDDPRTAAALYQWLAQRMAGRIGHLVGTVDALRRWSPRSAAEEAQRRGLVHAQLARPGAPRGLQRLAVGGRELAGVERRDDGRVHVRPPADRRRVAQRLGGVADRGLQEASARALAERLRARRGRRPEETAGHEHRAAPGPEVLGADVLAADVPEVVVDVAGVDRLHAPLGVTVAEQLVAG